MSDTATAAATTLAPFQVFYVKNVGHVPFEDYTGGKLVRIPVGGTVPVPFEAIDTWFGNPNAVDNPLLNRRDRTEEFLRLKIRYGAYESAEVWEAQKPLVEVTDVNGDKVITVIDDPEGRGVTPNTQSQAEVDLLRNALTQMQSQMLNMERQIADRERQDQGKYEAEVAQETGDVTEDTPQQIKTSYFK